MMQTSRQFTAWTEEAQMACPTGGPNPEGFPTIWSTEAVGAKCQSDPGTFGRSLFGLTAEWCRDHTAWAGALLDVVCYAREVVIHGEPGRDKDIASGFLLEAADRLMGTGR
jgi:hypothetical protein